MNEIIINTNEVESVWEKDHLCFIKMKSGKVWLCKEFKDVNLVENEHFGYGYSIKTKDYIKENKGLVCIELSQKGKSENNG